MMSSGRDAQKFARKVVLVTGAGRGLGRQVAWAFADRGAILAVNDVTPVNLDETLSALLASGAEAKAYVEDIAKKMPVQTLLNQVLDDFGRIDILVNCADVEPNRSILEMDEWDWQRTLDVDLTGPFLLLQSAGRIMREAKGGTIINVLKGFDELEGWAACQAARAGAAALVEAAVPEFAAFGVHVSLARTLEEVLEACQP
jgi:NAD(P)-dependent dehydrogenase (short-subunit alcohol dehydrogenase family)